MAQPRPETTERPGRVALGAILGAHGVRGLVRVLSFAAEPAATVAYGPLEDEGGRRLSVTLRGGTKDALIAEIDGVTTREAAERLKGTRLFVAREALPEAALEEFYHADLVGLEVKLRDGTGFGRVRAVRNFGAGDCLEIEHGEGDVLVPFTRLAVPEVNLAAGYLILDPPIGLLDD